MSLGAAPRSSGSRQLVVSLYSQACRAYSTTTTTYLAAETTSAPVPPQAQAQTPAVTVSELPDPETAYKWKELRQLRKAGINPVGSLRRRVALRTTGSIPFEQLPYQCFQEARKVLAQDRAEKLVKIESQKRKIANAEARSDESYGGAFVKKGALMAMRRHLEWLKVQADINDPVIKKRFEDNQGDMNKPIYRYLAERKWRTYERKVLMQRLTTMHVVPDLFSKLDPSISVKLAFRQRNVAQGDFVPSVLSNVPPTLHVQVFDRGPRYYTVAVVDPDVPDPAADSFAPRCHFLAANVELDPTRSSVPLARLDPNASVVVPWLPPNAQKGSPYHRLVTFVFEQPGRVHPMGRTSGQENNGAEEEEVIKGRLLDAAAMREKLGGGEERGFGARQIASKFLLRPVGVHMFRSVWDHWTASVMEKAGLPGADVELKRKRGEKLPPKKKDTSRYR